MNLFKVIASANRRRDAEECDDEDGASAQASAFTKKANKSGSPADHKSAAAAHGFAAALHEGAGNKDEAKHHATMQEGHSSSRFAGNPFKVAEK